MRQAQRRQAVGGQHWRRAGPPPLDDRRVPVLVGHRSVGVAAQRDDQPGPHKGELAAQILCAVSTLTVVELDERIDWP
nr:hypothetical protein [Mycobacterium sp.]